jgi:hypothetical protein
VLKRRVTEEEEKNKANPVDIRSVEEMWMIYVTDKMPRTELHPNLPVSAAAP